MAILGDGTTEKEKGQGGGDLVEKLFPQLLFAHPRAAKGPEPIAYVLQVDGCATNVSWSISNHWMRRPA